MATAEPASHLAGYDYVAAIDFGTWGTAVAVCPAKEEFTAGLCRVLFRRCGARHRLPTHAAQILLLLVETPLSRSRAREASPTASNPRRCCFARTVLFLA